MQPANKSNPFTLKNLNAEDSRKLRDYILGIVIFIVVSDIAGYLFSVVSRAVDGATINFIDGYYVYRRSLILGLHPGGGVFAGLVAIFSFIAENRAANKWKYIIHGALIVPVAVIIFMILFGTCVLI